jgi:hypothetical protein
VFNPGGRVLGPNGTVLPNALLVGLRTVVTF